MSTEDDLAAKIEKAEAELAALGQARERALERLAALRAAGSATNAPPQLRLPIANARASREQALRTFVCSGRYSADARTCSQNGGKT